MYVLYFVIRFMVGSKSAIFKFEATFSIPISALVLTSTVNVLHNMVLKTTIKQLKTAVSLKNIAGNTFC